MALKLRTVRGNGESAAGDEFDLVVKHPETGLQLDGVVIRCRALTKKHANDVSRRHQRQTPDPKTHQLVWQYTDDGAQATMDALMVDAIVGWTGFVGADDRELVCVPATILALDDRIKTQVLGAVFGAEVVEQQSFRQPAGVLSLVTDSRQ